MEVVETNGETKETEAETGAVTKETGVVTRETGVVVKVETGETSREGGTRETVGGTKDSGTRAPIRDTGYAFKYKVKLEMKIINMSVVVYLLFIWGFSSVILFCLQIKSFLFIIQKHLILLTFYINSFKKRLA